MVRRRHEDRRLSLSIHMPFLEVSPEREVFLLEKNFIIDTQL